MAQRANNAHLGRHCARHSDKEKNVSRLLENRVAIVTGGAKGLGLGISRRLAKDGAKVLITGRDGAATEEAARGSPAVGGLGEVGLGSK